MISIAIAGMELPAVLLDAILDGRWGPGIENDRFEHLFGSWVVDPRLYRLEGMISETDRWQAQDENDGLHYEVRVGARQGSGILDPTMSILIGDLGPDMPIALDYRDNSIEPEPMYLPPTGSWCSLERSIDRVISELCIGV